MTKEKEGVKDVAVVGNEKVLELTVAGKVLQVIDPEIERMFVEPQPHEGTKIAFFLARCVIPVQMDIFDIPEMLEQRIDQEGRQAEMMLPPDLVMLKNQIKIFREALGGQILYNVSNDPVDFFIPEAVANAKDIVKEYLASAIQFCNAIGKIRQQYASQEAYYMGQTLGKDTIQLDEGAVMACIQNHILDMNRLSSGWGGYRILALIKAVGKVANYLEDKRINVLFGASDVISLLNKLKYRIAPEQMIFHQNLTALSELVESIGASKKLSKPDIGTLIKLCSAIKSYAANNR